MNQIDKNQTDKTGRFASAVGVAMIFFIVITSLGISLAILPLFVNKILSLSPYFVGATVAAESVSTLASRAYSGSFSDQRGPKVTMIRGLWLAFASGMLAIAAILLRDAGAYLSFAVLIVSRVAMGIAESLVFTASGTWPIGLIGRAHAGKIMSWVGVAMFVGLAIGNYAGIWAYQDVGLLVGVIAMTVLPVGGIIIVHRIDAVDVHDESSDVQLHQVAKRVWKAGATFALSNIGYAAVTSYLTLLFFANGWRAQAALALALFGVGYASVRLAIGWRADTAGLTTVIVSLVVEAAGLLMLATAHTPALAAVGSFFAGAGMSMVYPLMAVSAIRSLPEKNIGLALSVYESCFDVGILLAGVVGGIIAVHVGYAPIFLFAFVCVLAAIVCAYLAYRQASAPVQAAACG